MNRIFHQKARRLPLLLAFVVLLSLGGTAALAGQLPAAIPTFQSPPQTPPANDNLADAEMITALPFQSVVDSTQATGEPGEPWGCGGSYAPQRTVWYAYTPSALTLLRANVDGSSFSDTVLTLYKTKSSAPGFGDLSYVTCVAYGGTIQYWASAGITYYFQAGDAWSGGGSLHFNLEQILPPANDNFANATQVSSLPFVVDYVDGTAATFETGEPAPSCSQYYGGVNGTIWYTFTPAETQSVTTSAGGSFPFVGVYKGTSLSNLQEMACRTGGESVAFRAEAGVTYYFQVGTLDNQTGSLSFFLKVAPPPEANFSFVPWDPSLFDTVQFYDYSWDPAYMGIATRAWDFGDGVTSTDQNPLHRYTQDGDYTVELTVTTYDGRTASTTQVVKVRTHDVAIVKLVAPNAARVGQTRSIVVEIKNSRYPERVQIQLFKSIPGGFQQVATTDQNIPVRSGNRTTSVSLSYTFAPDDAVMGKVTFKASATILDHRDALPADNEAISSPTKVSK